MESFCAHFKGGNASLFLETETVEELRKVIATQMDYRIYQRRDSSLAYRSPWEYLQGAGFIRRVLAETGVKSGPA